MLATKLQSIGMPEKEAKLYVALLEMGKAQASDIAGKAGINRGTAYSILQELSKKGLVAEIKKKGISDFMCSGPKSLNDYLEIEKSKIDGKMKMLKEFLPEIETLSALSGERTEASFFRGIEGIEYIRKEFGKHYKNKEIFHIFNADLAYKIYPVKKNDYRRKWLKQKMNLKSIIIYNPKTGIPQSPMYKGSENRYISEAKMPFDCEVLIYDKWFSIFDYQDDQMGVIIRQPRLVNAFKSWFRLAWDAAGSYAHKIEVG